MKFCFFLNCGKLLESPPMRGHFKSPCHKYGWCVHLLQLTEPSTSGPMWLGLVYENLHGFFHVLILTHTTLFPGTQPLHCENIKPHRMPLVGVPADRCSHAYPLRHPIPGIRKAWEKSSRWFQSLTVQNFPGKPQTLWSSVLSYFLANRILKCKKMVFFSTPSFEWFVSQQ